MSEEVRPMRAGGGWPITHLNGATAKSTTLKNGSGGTSSHWISGYQLDGALATGDGFYLLRRSCLYFNTTDTWTAADSGTVFDWGTAAASGHFALEMWVYIPTATGAHATLLSRGSATDGWVLSVGATGLVTFTVDDNTIATALTITSTKSVFGGWHMITVVCERASTTGLKMYIDGVSDATAKTTVALAQVVEGGTTIVSTGVSGKDTWLGPIGIYIGSSAALSAATVLANYNEGIGRKYDGGETGLAAAWNNDEGVGTTCYNILNVDGNKATVSGTAWSPSKQSGSTAAISKCGPPFARANEDDADDPLPTVGLFGTGLVTTSGVMEPIVVNFPQSIKIGRNNPVRILETDGAFSLLLHGHTGE